MRFSDGLWLTKNGYQVHYASQAYEILPHDNSLTVLATSSAIYNRAMTLGGVTLEITYTATADDTIKVRIVHHKGTLHTMPQFVLHEPDGYAAEITDTGEYIELHAGKTSVRIYRGVQWRVEFLRNGRKLTGACTRSTSYIEEEAFHAQARLQLQTGDRFFNAPADPRTGYTREQLSLDVGECVYGFGEKFTAFVKNGQTAEIWNDDGGTCSEQSYKSVPFCLSNRGYGIFVNSTGRVSFEVGSDTVAKLSMTLPGEELEYYLFGGDTPEDVIVRYTDLTGKPALPPAKSFGLWLSTSFTTDYNEETVNRFADGMAQRDIPLSMFHFDCFWMREFTWTSFVWDENMFPDPEKQLRNLHERGLGVCVWVNPYIAQRAEIFEECLAKGYFLKRRDGSVFQCDLWQPGMALVDFTNPEAYQWFGAQIRKLVGMGVDAVKTDFGERIPTDVVYCDGSDPIGMHNFYTYLYNQCVFEALESVKGKGNAVLFARSATAGGQKFPVHWGGDCSAEYTSMAETLRGGLSLSMCGFGFFSHDIGGFEQTAVADVYKRWCAFGLMSSHSRLHGSASYRVPWLYEEDTPDQPENACAVLRFFTKLKGRLMPYLYAQAARTHETGIPMMRAMVLRYPDDPAVPYLDRQYLLGDSLLCAPVMNAEGTADVYLPAGIWTDILTGEQYEGGRFYRRTCSFLQMPIYAAPDSVIVYGDFRQNTVYDYVQNAEAVIYSLTEGKTAETVVCDSSGKPEITITARRQGGSILVRTTPTDKAFTVRLHGGGSAVLGGAVSEAVL
ncbi:MAG: alpha-xylosidase [Oscillospiraceae bacterium]|nr:alpha-xylosidase [Oscillospiraceae bacterium]